MTSPSRRALFDAPGRYEIRVNGHLDLERTSTLAGILARVETTPDEYGTTTLSGTLIDQACLLGVLTELYDMGYTLLEARRLS
jgi:hypothetical protein